MAEREGIEAEILNLRTLVPYYCGTVTGPLRCTNRVLVAQEDCLSLGYGPRLPRVSRMSSSNTWMYPFVGSGPRIPS
ncbi:MAG: hypothetical protein GX934_07340 [Burkholderiales bacterium]|nr:hypothetical protein [Burkholderiales bacterium]